MALIQQPRMEFNRFELFTYFIAVYLRYTCESISQSLLFSLINIFLLALVFQVIKVTTHFVHIDNTIL